MIECPIPGKAAILLGFRCRPHVQVMSLHSLFDACVLMKFDKKRIPHV